MRRGVLAVVGGRVDHLERVRCRRKPILIAPGMAALRRRVVGRTITAVDRIGKRVAVVLDSEDRLLFEPRMTGLVLLAEPPSREHLRFRLGLSGCSAGELLYWDRRGLGSVRLMSDRELAEAYSAAVLGPDALSVTPELLRERLGRSRREIKVALLDQRAIAGVGNLYAAEILHAAGIHPAARCDRLSRKQWRLLCDSLHNVLAEAIEYEGSTLADGTYRNALNQSGGYQKHHRVYARAGQPCPRCGAEVERTVQAQRATFFCPACQRRR